MISKADHTYLYPVHPPIDQNATLPIKKSSIPHSALASTDKWICLSTALDLGLTTGLNAILTSEAMDPSTKRKVAICSYLILQTNKIWKQSLVSQILPSNASKAVRWISSPIGALVAIGLSYGTNNRIFEIPMSLLSTYFISVNAFSKMDRNEPSWKIFIHLLNASGAAISTLDTMGVIHSIDPENWKKTISHEEPLPPETKPEPNLLDEIHKQDRIREEQNQMREKEAEEERIRDSTSKDRYNTQHLEDLFNQNEKIKKESTSEDVNFIHKTTEEMQKAKEEVDRINASLDNQYQKLEQAYEEVLRSFKSGGLTVKANCSKIEASAMEGLENFTRLTQASLNPECPDHAKIILTPKGEVFDETLFKEKGCDYIKPVYRRLSLLAAPDKNRQRLDEAAKAATNLNIAKQTLCAHPEENGAKWHSRGSFV